MDIIVNRQKSAKDWTLSTFESICKTVKGVGVEDEYRSVKVHGETRIPQGQYEITLTPSPHFSKEYYRDEEGNLILAKDWNVANPETKRKYAWQHELITMNGIVVYTNTGSFTGSVASLVHALGTNINLNNDPFGNTMLNYKLRTVIQRFHYFHLLTFLVQCPFQPQ